MWTQSNTGTSALTVGTLGHTERANCACRITSKNSFTSISRGTMPRILLSSQAHGPRLPTPCLYPKRTETPAFALMQGVNSNSRKDRCPMPRAKELIAEVRDAKFFTIIDLTSAFNACLLHIDDRHKTCFYVGRQGFRQYKRLSMGLANGSSHF